MTYTSNVELWQKAYSGAIHLVFSSLALLNKDNEHIHSSAPIPTHFNQHNKLIEQLLTMFMKATNQEGYFFKSDTPDSSLETLRAAIHRDNENHYLVSIEYDPRPGLLSKGQSTNPRLNYNEAYLEILQLNTLIISEAADLTLAKPNN